MLVRLTRWQSVVLRPLASSKVSLSSISAQGDQQPMTQKGELKHYANQKNSGEAISRQCFRWHLSQPRLTSPPPILFNIAALLRSPTRMSIVHKRRHDNHHQPLDPYFTVSRQRLHCSQAPRNDSVGLTGADAIYSTSVTRM